MPHHKSPNNFYKMIPPAKIWYNRSAKKWRLLDNIDTIIADNLTEKLAETLRQAVNFCGVAIDFTQFFVECEHLVRYRENNTPEETLHRNTGYIQAHAFLTGIGVVEPLPTYVDALPAWRNELMQRLHQVILKGHQHSHQHSQQHKPTYEDKFTELYRRVTGT